MVETIAIQLERGEKQSVSTNVLAVEQRVALVALSKEGPSKGRVVQVLNAERMGREENSLAKRREAASNTSVQKGGIAVALRCLAEDAEITTELECQKTAQHGSKRERNMDQKKLNGENQCQVIGQVIGVVPIAIAAEENNVA